jgi:hypothetical protein
MNWVKILGLTMNLLTGVMHNYLLDNIHLRTNGKFTNDFHTMR